jgi:hypothetical protein
MPHTNYIGQLLGFGLYDYILLPLFVLAIYLSVDFFIERFMGQPSGPVIFGFLLAIPSWLFSLAARRQPTQQVQHEQTQDPSSATTTQQSTSAERPKFKRAR